MLPHTAQNTRPTQEDWKVRYPNLKRVGAELKGPCPACGGTDRFSVNKQNLIHCRHGCSYEEMMKAAGFWDKSPTRSLTTPAQSHEKPHREANRTKTTQTPQKPITPLKEPFKGYRRVDLSLYPFVTRNGRTFTFIQPTRGQTRSETDALGWRDHTGITEPVLPYGFTPQGNNPDVLPLDLTQPLYLAQNTRIMAALYCAGFTNVTCGADSEDRTDGAAGGLQHQDWRPINDADVVLVPANTDAGRATMNALGDILRTQACRLRILQYHSNHPIGFTLEAIQERLTQDVVEWIPKTESYTQRMARTIRDRSVPATDTPAETYCRNRRVWPKDTPLDPPFRWVDARHLGQAGPDAAGAIVFTLADRHGDIQAVQFEQLTATGTRPRERIRRTYKLGTAPHNSYFIPHPPKKPERIVLCEGPMDVLACFWHYGSDTLVATSCGLPTTARNWIFRPNIPVTIEADSGPAGRDAANRKRAELTAHGLTCTVVHRDTGDPADDYRLKGEPHGCH